MEKKHIITLAGKPGSGKSTTSKAVAQQLGYQHFSSGDLFRAVAKERGLDVKQANLQAESESSIDDLVDARLQEIGRTEDYLVIDSRTAWHWMPQSFKVYLDLDLEVAAKRILAHADETRSENELVPESVQEYVHELQERLDSESRRYMKLYNINPYDTTNYDLVIDTATGGIDSIVEQVIAAYKEWQA